MTGLGGACAGQTTCAPRRASDFETHTPLCARLYLACLSQADDVVVVCYPFQRTKEGEEAMIMRFHD